MTRRTDETSTSALQTEDLGCHKSWLITKIIHANLRSSVVVWNGLNFKGLQRFHIVKLSVKISPITFNTGQFRPYWPLPDQRAHGPMNPDGLFWTVPFRFVINLFNSLIFSWVSFLRTWQPDPAKIAEIRTTEIKPRPPLKMGVNFRGKSHLGWIWNFGGKSG